MRIGLVCPYSLTVPGGVQGQVLGLARALRPLGHEARVLGPCDGPPPDAGVTPLGRSVPTAANGSVAPLAPDPSAQLRTIRALRDEGFDVVHLHEPIAPGPAMTALLFADGPLVGTFHAAGTSAAYRYMGWALRRMAKRLDHRVAVSPDATALAENGLGGDVRAAVQRHRGRPLRQRAGPPDGRARPSSSSAGTSPARASTCCSTAFGRPARRRAAVGRRRRPPVRASCGSATPTTAASSGSAASATRSGGARMRGCTVFCSPSVRGESFGMVLLEAMAAGCALVASDLDGHRNVATDGVDALLAPVGDPPALAKALRAGARRRRPAGRAGRRRPTAGRRSSRWRAWPSATCEIYRQVLDGRAAADRADRRERPR